MFRGRLCALLVLVCACKPSPGPSNGKVDGKALAERLPSPGNDPDLSDAWSFGRTQDGPQDLALEKLTVDVTPGPQATRSHLVITVGNPGEDQAEAGYCACRFPPARP